MGLIRTGPFLIFGVVIGALNFWRTETFRRRRGYSPWGIHPVFWGLASIPISLVVTVLSAVAASTSKPPNRLQGPGSTATTLLPGTFPNPPHGGGFQSTWTPVDTGQPVASFLQPAPAPYTQQPVASTLQPAPYTQQPVASFLQPAPAPYTQEPVASFLQPAPAPYTQQPVASFLQPAPAPLSQPNPVGVPPGWHPDPTGRHHYRYWDGYSWSHHVSSHGTAGVDPLT